MVLARPLAGPIKGSEDNGSPEHLLGVQPSTAGGIGEHLADACVAAAVPVFTPHGLRRLAVDELYGQGVDPLVAAQLVGHSPAVALRHCRSTPRPAALRDAAARLGHLPEGKVLRLRRQGEE